MIELYGIIRYQEPIRYIIRFLGQYYCVLDGKGGVPLTEERVASLKDNRLVEKCTYADLADLKSKQDSKRTGLSPFIRSLGLDPSSVELEMPKTGK